uniref:Protein kinase domain-containing protein n=1 Tax=viral metagenome TaxID=1070528 RepID=A0A6C0B6D8_9ZZZZ
MPPPKLSIQRTSVPFDHQIETYINQLPKDIPRFDNTIIPTKATYLHQGSYSKTYLHKTNIIKEIDLQAQINNPDPKIIKKIKISIQSEIAHYYAISEICPNVCKMLGYSYDSINHKLYIHMENCGKDLFDIYSYINFPETIHYFIGQIISAVKCLHQNGFVHRDLKPENITVSDDGTIKLIDFGMARRDGDIVFKLGTPGYVSPENTQRGELSFDMLKASDIWSLGVTIMFMLLPRALINEIGPKLSNDIIIELFSYNPKPNTPLTFIGRMNTLFPKIYNLFPKDDGDLIKRVCSQELVKIFGPSITFDSFFSNDWTKRASIEDLKTAFDNQTSAIYAVKPPSHTTVSSLTQKTTSKGGKSLRKKRGSKLAKNAGPYKKTRSSRK